MMDDDNFKGACSSCGMFIYADGTGHSKKCPTRWRKTWPTKPGWYWAWRKARVGRAPEMRLVRVVHTANNAVLYFSGSLDIRKDDMEFCYWRDASLPEAPTKEQIAEAE